MSIRVGLRHMARSAVAVPEPWIDDWDYRKSHEIDGSAAGAQEDYQVKIRVNYGEGTYFEDNGMHNPFFDGDNPSSVYYNGKTYIVWQGGAGYDPFIASYDHSANAWSYRVQIASNPLSSDSHGAPTILIDDSGYIHIFYGSHVTNQKYAISDNPEDITAWTVQADPATMATYPDPVMMANGDIYLFLRKSTAAAGKHQEIYIRSDDGGASWGAENIIIEVDANTHAIYIYTPRVHGNNIHMIWRYHDGADSENVYHAYLNTLDGHMYSMDGTDLGTSITKAEADANCRVVNTGAYIPGHMALQLDGDGYPYIIYRVSTDVGFDYGFIRWTGAAWPAAETITTTDHGNNGMDFIVHSATSITAFLIGAGGAGQGGDINEWSWNGAAWSEIKTILSEADSGRALIHPEVVKDYDSELVLIFSQYGGVDVDSLELYAYNGTNFVPREDESVYCHENCRTDFGDVRFTESDKVTELEYWIQEKTDSDYAIFWVKVPSIPADPDSATIYMYYGKADATTTESGTNTWIDYEDWESYALDAVLPLGEFEATDITEVCKIDDNRAFKGTKSLYLDDDHVVNRNQITWNYPNKTSGGFRFLLALYQDTNYGGFSWIFHFYNSLEVACITLRAEDDFMVVDYYAGGYHDTDLSITEDIWDVLEMCVVIDADTWDFRLSGEWASNRPKRANLDALLYTVLNLAYAGGKFRGNLGACVIGKYIDPEPTHGSWGTEESH